VLVCHLLPLPKKSVLVRIGAKTSTGAPMHRAPLSFTSIVVGPDVPLASCALYRLDLFPRFHARRDYADLCAADGELKPNQESNSLRGIRKRCSPHWRLLVAFGGHIRTRKSTRCPQTSCHSHSTRLPGLTIPAAHQTNGPSGSCCRAIVTP
jgi:hypothetical protein